jgi:ADP-ribose pyrophosphatase YjhB (NUDIX family)
MTKDPHETLDVEVISRGLATSNGRVLLCQDRKHGYYYLPGGHVEFGETAAAGLSREFQEEAGISVKVGELAFVHEHIFRQGRRVRHELNLVFHVELPGPLVVSQEEKIAFEWADLATISEKDIRPEAARMWLSRPIGGTIRFESDSLT